MNQHEIGAGAFLKMFSSTAEDLLGQKAIDSPANAMTLEHHLHLAFGDMEFYFDHAEGDTYNVLPWPGKPPILNLPAEGRKVTFEQHGTCTELPSRELLKLHYDIGQILHMSAAAEDVDRLLRLLERGDVDEGGEMPLGALVNLQLLLNKVRVH